MNIRITLLAAACALALTACGDKAPATTEKAAPAPTTTATPAPVDNTPAATVSGGEKTAAATTGCAIEIEGNDAMQFSVGSISVPASCSDFTITLKHTGKLPASVMGHNVVISAVSDMAAVAADGLGAGIGSQYVKPDDTRVIAFSHVIGGGETTSVTFPVSKISEGGPYEFFCSYPGHSTIMKGSIAVE